MKARRVDLSTWVCVAATLLGLGQSAARLSPVNVTNLPLAHGLSGAAVSGNYLYTIGSGFQIFNISNPANPTNVSTTTIPGGGGRLAVSGNYAYVTESTNAAGGGRLDIFDISNPANPLQAGSVEGTWGGWSGFAVSDGRAYLPGSDGSSLGVFIYDVSTPGNPLELGRWADPGLIATSIAVSGHYAYLSCTDTEAGADGFQVWDVSNPALPQQVGFLPLHYGWQSDIAVEGDYAYVAKGTTNALLIFNVSDPVNPVIVATPVCLIDAGVALCGNYACMAWDGQLSGVDISNPTNSTVAFWGQPGLAYTAWCFKPAVSHGYAFLPSTFGLNVWSLGIPSPSLHISTTPGNPVVLSWPTPGGAFSIQQSSGLNPVSWLTLTNQSVVIDSHNQVTLPAMPGSMFYRLVAD